MAENADNSPKKDEDEEKVTPKIVYIGGDQTYYNNLVEKYKELFPSIEVDFQHAFENDDKKIQSLVLKIKTAKPRLVIIDMGQNENAMLHLIRLWKRHNSLVKTEVMGLCDYTQGRAMVIKAIMTTAPCVHIKSSELEAVCYDITMLAFPLLVEDHKFALAELADPIKAYHPAKAAMMNENFLKIESNFPMQQKQQLRVHNYWNRAKIMGSNLMMCASQSEENIYYNYQYTQFMQLAHADPVEQTPEMTQEDFQALNAKRQEQMQVSKQTVTNWIAQHKQYSKPKFLKALVVDKKGVFLEDQPLSDSYVYVFRNQPFLNDAKKELSRVRPQLIIWNLENTTKAEKDANADIAHTYNDLPNLAAFTRAIGEVFQGYQPVIIVFNAGEQDTNQLKATLNYQSILAVKEPIDIQMVLKVCEMLRAKILPSLPQPGPTDVYIDKNSDISYLEIETDIILKGCSENDIYFDCETPIPDGTVLRVSLPVPMYVTVCKKPEFATLASQYYGFIHGIGESERQQLRRYINDIFFREHDQKKVEEAQEAEALKQKYIQEKEAERIAAEEAASKALEDKASAIVSELDGGAPAPEKKEE